MPFESERDELLFCVKMALMHCGKVILKPERNEEMRGIQAKAIVEHLERSGWRIVKDGHDANVRPSNIGA
jgi:hypothetical protein